MLKTMLLALAVAGCIDTRPAVTTHPQDVAVAELAGRRATMIGWLHAYAQAGEFPVGPDGMPRSVFRDDRGVRCPMAELIHKSGRDDLVDTVVRTNNALRLADVHDGPLHDWMLGSGLTETEIAMVQGALEPAGMDLDLGNRMLATAEARAEVRGRLATAETALRDGTRHALADAAARLPRDRDVLATK